MVIDLASRKELTVPALMKAAMAEADVRAKGVKDAPKMAADAVKAYANVGQQELEARGLDLDETQILSESVDFLRAEFGCEFLVQNADDAQVHDPVGKSRFAQPRKPAVLVEA